MSWQEFPIDFFVPPLPFEESKEPKESKDAKAAASKVEEAKAKAKSKADAKAAKTKEALGRAKLGRPRRGKGVFGSYRGFQLVMGIPPARWMVDFREKPNLEMDDGGLPLF